MFVASRSERAARACECKEEQAGRCFFSRPWRERSRSEENSLFDRRQRRAPFSDSLHFLTGETLSSLSPSCSRQENLLLNAAAETRLAFSPEDDERRRGKEKMLSRIVAASLRRGSCAPAVSPALFGDVLPPLQWDRLFSSDTTEGGEQGRLLRFRV